MSIGAGLKGVDGLTASEYTSGVANVSALAFDVEGQMWAATAAYEDDEPTRCT